MSSPSLSDQSSPRDPTLDASTEVKRESMDVDVDVDEDDDDDDDDLMLDSSGSDSDEGSNALFIDTTVRKSAYMTEKSTKKKIFKDGKVGIYSNIRIINIRNLLLLFQLILSRPQRKDKGKSRFTAYMLWAKDVRQQMVIIKISLINLQKI